MGYHDSTAQSAMPLIRPKLLIKTAQIGARLYRRERDLAGALPGLPNDARHIVTRLSEAERNCEELRRGRSPTYQPARHVQILSALIAESRMSTDQAPDQAPGQTKASGSEALRVAI